MAAGQSRGKLPRRSVLLAVLLCPWAVGSGPVRYAVPEEMDSGSFVANVAADLGLDPQGLSARRARVASESSRQHFQLDRATGALFTAEKLDREELCGEAEPCTLQLEIILENPLQSYRAEVRVEDVNDHAPEFSANELLLQMPETTPPGSRFPLGRALDLDVGNNSLQGYAISAAGHFRVATRPRSDGRKYAELVLERPLDREEQVEMRFVLTAWDGGSPARTGTAQVRVIVLDANDNVPEFSQAVYRARVWENSDPGSVVLSVSARDPDEGLNGAIAYSFSQKSGTNLNAFAISPDTGDIRLLGPLDFEETATYEIDVQATDGGGLSAHSKVLLEVMDVNDNAPEVKVTSLISPIPEDSAPETVVALFNVRDRDSGDSGRTACSIEDHLPFFLKPTSEHSYSLVTERALDREQRAEYNITIRARDLGAPSLCTEQRITVKISDVNDNAPQFSQTSYTLRVRENSGPALLLGKVAATDSDAEQNAKVTYSLWPAEAGGLSVLSYLSINAESGQVYALRSLDYEERREFEVRVRASDSGSPPLSAEVTVRVAVLDANDNAPFLLCPLQNSSSPGAELVPRWAGAGYLVTKVVAVDEDAGQNSWLSYQLLKATEPGLFAVSSHNGEIRTTRLVTERDATRQKLVVVVRDSGEPALSSSATLSVALVEGFSDAHLQFPEAVEPEEKEDTLTLYLILSLCLVSAGLFMSVIIFIALRLCRRRNCGEKYASAAGRGYGDGNLHNTLVDVAGDGTVSQRYRYEVCLTTGSGTSEFRFLRPVEPSRPPQLGTAGTGSAQDQDQDLLGNFHLPADMDSANQQAQPNPDWRFSQAQRPGTSGSQNGEEGGTWPNNQFDTEMLQAMILASANEAADGNSTLGGGAGTMGLSTRYGPQFTLQHVPDYRQNVYIPGSTATLSNSSGKRDGKSSGSSGGNKKKSGKKEKK